MFDVQKYKEILDCYKSDLGCLDNEIKSLLFTNKTEIYENLNGFLFAKSKRLRPLVLFLFRDFFGADGANVTKLAAALEILHAATLIHDDIIDDAEKRRGMTAFHKEFDSKTAVIAGDFLLSLSLSLLSELNSVEIFKHFCQNTLQICKGEISQFFSKNQTGTIEDYLEKSKNKTSSLFMAGVKSLISLVEAEKTLTEKEKNSALNYTLNFSLGFQIYDDIENFKNENKDKISSDIKNGIYTLPYLYLSQQNHSYGIIDYENLNAKQYNEALKFSENFLNSILDKAILSLDGFQNKKEGLIQLAEIFKK